MNSLLTIYIFSSRLQPCMGYNVTTYLLPKKFEAFLETETLEIVEHAKELVYTEYDTPLYWIETIVTKEEELSIIWKADNRYCINKFSYEVKNNVTMNANSNVDPETNPIVVSGLHACQTYTVNLTAFDVNSTQVGCKEEKSCEQSTEMKYKHPEDIMNVSVGNETGAIIKLSWNNPADVSCVKNYTIFYKIVDSEKWETEEIKDQVATEYLLYGVYGCEKYLLDVQLNIDLKSFNESQLADTAQEFQAPVITSHDQLDLVLKDEVSAEKTITVTLSWQQPQNHSKCVKHFNVEMLSLEENQHSNQTIDSSQTSITFDDLYPCSNYQFAVTPLTEHEVGVKTVMNKTLQEVSKYSYM